VAYTAEIQIAIKGAKELQRLQDRIKETSKLINKVNTDIEAVAGGGVVRSINNLSKTVADAAAAFNEVALETGEAALAAKAFVDANKNLNRGLQERITLLNNVAQEERRLAEEQRKRSLRAAGIVERTQYAGPIGPGEASSVALSSPLRGRVQQIIDERNGAKQLEQALLSLEMRRVKETNAILDEKAAQVALNLERKKEAGFFNSPGMRPQAQKSKGPSFRERLSDPSSKLGSAVIGGGFPALMGGGPGTIAGGAIGGLLGGFAGSIGGSAIGQFLDTAIQKVQELGNAINTLNFDKVVESGVRLTGELRTQLDLLVKVGQAQQAQERLSQEVASVTGTSAGTTEDISNAVNLLNAAFNSVVSTVSTLLGIIGAPFVAALAAALGLVSLIAKGLNVVLGFVGKLIKDAGKFVVNLIGGEDAVRNLERSLAGVNGQFDEAIAKANQLRGELNQAVVTAAQNLGFERRMTPGSTAGEKLTNNDVELEKKLAGLTVDRLNANIKIREDNAQAELAVPGTIAGLVKQNNLAFDLLEKTEKLVAARRAESIQIQENARLAREAAQAAEKAQRQAEARTNSLIQIEKELYNVDLQRIALNVQQVGIEGGTEAALERQFALTESKKNISVAILKLDQQSALAEAAKLGTTAQVNVLYAAKLKLLNLQLDTEKAITDQAQRQLELDKFVAAQTAVNTAVKPIQDFLADQEQEVQLAKIYSRLLMEGVLPAEAQRQVNFEKIVAAQLRSLDIQIATEKSTLAQAEKLQLVGQALEKQIQLVKDLEAARAGVTTMGAAGPGLAAPEATPVEKVTEKVGKLKEEIAALTNIGNIAITVADGIGAAFADAFTGLISGTMTAKEALGSFFKSVADMFLEMAAQIIAKQITMIILQTILKALGGGAFSGGTSSAVPTDAAGWTDSFNTKLPGITSVGKIGFAKGGAFSNSIVSSPTLFKFADGGTTRTGLMGEAGPEAIMPLKRGSDGSLGVQASGLREAMGAAPGSTGGGAPVLNMSFQSSTINGVEYVSRDQLEAAMAQTRRDASRDGAKRGMTMTLDKLQQSPSTRSRVGMR
jgi:phage-related minor tail protein